MISPYFPRERWMRYYSPDQSDHLLHYVLAERYDYKEFLWRETRCTEHFRQWIKSMSDKIWVKLTLGGREMLQALFVFRRCRNMLPEGAVRSLPDTSFDDSHSTSRDGHFLTPLQDFNTQFQWLSRNLTSCFDGQTRVIKWQLRKWISPSHGLWWPLWLLKFKWICLF